MFTEEERNRRHKRKIQMVLTPPPSPIIQAASPVAPQDIGQSPIPTYQTDTYDDRTPPHDDETPPRDDKTPPHQYDDKTPPREDSEDGVDRNKPQLKKMRHLPALSGCRSVDNFEKLNRVEEGTYGVVYKARDRGTGEIVALKKIKMDREKEGFPITSLREIRVLMTYKHPNVVDVREIVVGKKLENIFIVMEFLDHDLRALMEEMKEDTRFLTSEVKCLMIQLLSGVAHLHDNWIVHR